MIQRSFAFSKMLSHKLLPVLFLSHGGGPAHRLDYKGSRFSELDKNSKSAAFLRELPHVLEEYTPLSTIRCILVVTAHWDEPEFTVDYQTGPQTKLVYDYYGFPKEAYAPYLTYPVETDLAIADKVYNLLKDNQIPVQKKDRGFDHGTFMPLSMAFPEAKIPVVQISLKSSYSVAEHFRLGELLRPLRKEGVLIIGSGQITHNLRAIGESDNGRSKQFTDFIYEQVNSLKTSSDYETFKQLFISETNKIPHYAYSHPTVEHFLPFLVSVAAGVHDNNSEGEEKSPQIVESKRIYEEMVMGSMAVDSYLFM
jgi:4,5-DOPA dioxygenase extradiol